MWKNVICSILGFVAGCSFRDLLQTKRIKKDNNRRSHTSPTEGHHNGIKHIDELSGSKNNQFENEKFSLNAIKDVFSAYNVELINYGSFSILLREIKYNCYKNLLKMFIDKATSAEKLVAMLKEDITPAFVVDIKPSSQSPFISDKELDEYIKGEGAMPDEIGTREEKVKFLLTISHAHGVENFRNILGGYLTEILECAEHGEDITELYQHIIKIIESRYEYVS